MILSLNIRRFCYINHTTISKPVGLSRVPLCPDVHEEPLCPREKVLVRHTQVGFFEVLSSSSGDR